MSTTLGRVSKYASNIKTIYSSLFPFSLSPLSLSLPLNSFPSPLSLPSLLLILLLSLLSPSPLSLPSLLLLILLLSLLSPSPLSLFSLLPSPLPLSPPLFLPTQTGALKIVEECEYPLTGKHCIDRIITQMVHTCTHPRTHVYTHTHTHTYIYIHRTWIYQYKVILAL